MKKEIDIRLTIFKNFVLWIILTLLISFVSAVTINVPGNFSTIQEAVNSASSGDTINVTGVFNESILVNKSLSVIGNNATISGSPSATSPAFNITASNVLLQKFNIFVDPLFSGGAVRINGNESNVPSNVKIIFNNFIGGVNGTGIALKNNINITVNGTFNFYSFCDGPPQGIGHFGVNGTGSNITGNASLVIFKPFIGICIANKTNTNCSFTNNNANLSANINGSFIDTVIFSYTINGTNFNKTGIKTPGSLINYSYTINSSEFSGKGGKNVSWNIYVNDSFGNNFSNGLQTFYVRNITILNITPGNPNGLSGWFVVEPNFTLIKDFLGLRSYYRWDAISEILFTGVFGLENIPNQPKQSAGTLELNYWSEFVCGNETIQNQTLKIDLTNPEIKNLVPANNSTVFNNARPTIQALLDEVYQSNSGINKSNVSMRLDGSSVSINIIDVNDFDPDSLDAIVRHNPTSDLSQGLHNVTVFVQDNAGRSNRTTWFFTINLSTEDFNLTVNSPVNGSLGTRRISFNITTTKIVEKIEFINYNDKNPRFERLCKNCDEYGFSDKKIQTLNEGYNNITIKATNGFNKSKEVNLSVYIDSKGPKILKILPKINSIVNGSNFYIKFIEENLKQLIVIWNPTQNVSNCNSVGKNSVECFVNLNLTSFNGQFINFSFNISDSVNNISSEKIKVKVDTTKPVLTINDPKNKTGNESYVKKVPFNLTISENVSLEFIDNSVSNPKFKSLCVNCDKYGFKRAKTKSFKKGIHDILIRAVDKAGNSDVKNIKFEVV